MADKILIVGGVAGGATAAARLRRLDENAEIIIFERGEYISFANCGLPYFIGDIITQKSALTLQTPKSFNTRFNIDVRVLSEVISIDRQNKTVAVKNVKTNETYNESYDKLLLSPGAEPVRPDIDGMDCDRVFTLRNIADTYKIKDYINDKKPKKAAVVGGGYIGVEMAENLTNLGIAVSVIERSEQILPPLDYDMACTVHKYIQSKGIRLILNNSVKNICDNGALKLTLNDCVLDVDFVVMAIGVLPETMIAKEAEITVNERGSIVVSDSMQTNDSDIFAVGDAVQVTNTVTGEKAFIPLAGPANKQGRIAADNICGLDSRYLGTQGSSIIKIFEMTVASTGINEKTAKHLDLNYEKSFTCSTSHANYYPGATGMSVKTIFEKETGKVLGAQITGFDGVDKRADVYSTAVYAKMTAFDLTNLELCYAPPYSSAKDPVNMAGYVIEDILKGKCRIFHWHDVAGLPRNGDINLLDTRTVMEFNRGSIDGFINIPLDELRDRLNELDRSKPVYVTCQVGLRGYLAVRILVQNGFDAYNLSGGYHLYKTILG